MTADEPALGKILTYAQGMTMTEQQAAAIGEAAQEKRASWA
jgi:hypothetical protein